MFQNHSWQMTSEQDAELAVVVYTDNRCLLNRSVSHSLVNVKLSFNTPVLHCFNLVSCNPLKSSKSSALLPRPCTDCSLQFTRAIYRHKRMLVFSKAANRIV